ncbi:MAG: RNA polymerase sigma factor [Lentimicrobiaceae bacterium]|nr:RNA polymerase sigma factor [Lentimicrobiaceae bacterium]
MTDKELIQGLIDGDQQAAAFLVNEYQVMVYNACYSFLHNVHNAEDVTQDVFIEAIKHAGRFRLESKISTWLYRIAINRSLNFIRNNRKHRVWYEINDFFNSSKQSLEPQTEADPAEQLEQKNIIARAIDGLPDNQKIAFSLNKLEGLSYAEVAEIMDRKLPAVESLLHRARLNLQKKLKAYYEIE